MAGHNKAGRKGTAAGGYLSAGLIVLVAVLLFGFALAACGSTPTSGTTAATTGTTAVGRLSSAGISHIASLPYISISKDKLSTPQLTIPTNGAMVFWNNEDDPGVDHHLVADNGSFDTGVLRPGDQYVIIFGGNATVSFHDALNPDIKGVILVTTPVTDTVPSFNPYHSTLIVVAGGKLNTTDITLRAGDVVSFINSEGGGGPEHRFIADDGSFDTGILEPGQQFSFTFVKAGTYAFHDTLDPSIKGTITVK